MRRGREPTKKDLDLCFIFVEIVLFYYDISSWKVKLTLFIVKQL
jgi:hypothetical protein